MRTIGIVVVAVLSWAGRSEASCVDLRAWCFCQGYGQVGIVVTEAVDGNTATLRVESAQLGLDGGLTRPQQPGEVPGSRWLLLNEERRPINEEGLVGCPLAQAPASVPATEVARAAVSPNCREELAQLNFVNPPCNDTGGRCSTSPLRMPLLALCWFLRRRFSSR